MQLAIALRAGLAPEGGAFAGCAGAVVLLKLMRDCVWLRSTVHPQLSNDDATPQIAFTSA